MNYLAHQQLIHTLESQTLIQVDVGIA